MARNVWYMMIITVRSHVASLSGLLLYRGGVEGVVPLTEVPYIAGLYIRCWFSWNIFIVFQWATNGLVCI